MGVATISPERTAELFYTLLERARDGADAGNSALFAQAKEITWNQLVRLSAEIRQMPLGSERAMRLVTFNNLAHAWSLVYT